MNVGRTEKEIDEQRGPVAQFALALRAARDAIGKPKYRNMAKTAGVSSGALSKAASGKRVPTWQTTKAYLRACRVLSEADLAVWHAKWEQMVAAANAARVAERAARGEAPLARQPADRLMGSLRRMWSKGRPGGGADG
jgi:hypothetical protein